MDSLPSLATLPFLLYLNESGQLPQDFAGQIGAYAIYDDQQNLVHFSYSRDVLLSLKQNLIRCPSACHWVKIATIDRPSKSLLEEILKAWQDEVGDSPYHDQNLEKGWNQSINVLEHLTVEEKQNYESPAIDDRSKVKLLKQSARRIEAQILEVLAQRGFQEELRFNPKLKETGVLEVKG